MHRYVCVYVCMYVCVCMYVSMCVCVYVCMYYVRMYVCAYVCLCLCMFVCMYLCVYVCVCFYIDINNMPHYTVTLHALHNLSFSFTITFTFNNKKTIVEIHYNVDNNILTPSVIMNNIYINSLRSICLSVCLSISYSKASLQTCKVYRFNKFYKICKYLLTSVSFVVGQFPPIFLFVLSFHSFGYVISYTEILSSL